MAIVTPRPTPPLYRAIAADLAQQIEDGRLGAGNGILPTATRFASAYGTSTSTITHALRVLEEEQVIHRDGQRWYVRRKPSAGRRMLERRKLSGSE
jgi:DNA-binding GntR family transcriptional regulator